MKFPLSISSFNTLKISFTFPKALFACICFWVLAEILASILLYIGFLEQDKSLQKLINENIDSIERKRPSVWLIGNSTLDAIDEKVFSTIERPYIKLIHGGATLHGSAAMLDFYLRRTSVRPEYIVLFIIKDDVNLNGFGATTSKKYLDLTTWKKYFIWNYSNLRSVRYAILTKIMTAYCMVFVPENKRSRWWQKYSSLKLGTIDPKAITREMMKNYTFDTQGFEHLLTVCKYFFIHKIAVVLLPISNTYEQWHDRLYPHISYKKIRNYIRTQCSLKGFTFIDVGDSLPKENFADFFHLDDRRCQQLNAIIESELKNFIK